MMGYPINIYAVSMELSILYFKWLAVKNPKWSLKIVFILANSVDPDEMLPYGAFHLGLHCCPKYLFTGIQNENG